MTQRYPEIGVTSDVIIPVVGECDDSWLNDAGGQHVRAEHVYAAIDTATDGRVEEGAVGGGTGMVASTSRPGSGRRRGSSRWPGSRSRSGS
jgi:D-aminopeptidase